MKKFQLLRDPQNLCLPLTSKNSIFLDFIHFPLIKFCSIIISNIENNGRWYENSWNDGLKTHILSNSRKAFRLLVNLQFYINFRFLDNKILLSCIISYVDGFKQKYVQQMLQNHVATKRWLKIKIVSCQNIAKNQPKSFILREKLANFW